MEHNTGEHEEDEEEEEAESTLCCTRIYVIQLHS